MAEEQDQQQEQQHQQPQHKEAPPKPQAQQHQAEEAPPKAKVNDDQYTAMVAELTKLRTKAAQYEAAEERRREEETRRQQRELIEGGQLERLVKQHDEEVARANRRATEAEERYKAAERRRELSMALNGHKLVKGAAEQLTRLWDGEFEVFPMGEGWQVRSKDLKSPVDWVREKLASEEYAHFVVADSRGGRGGQGGQATTPSPAQPGSGEPRRGSVADAIAARMQTQQEENTAWGWQPGKPFTGVITSRGLHRTG